MASVTSVFTEAPDDIGDGGKIQITKVLDLSVGDCVQFPRDGTLIKRKIKSFRWGNMANSVEQGVTPSTGINFENSNTPLMKRDFDKGLEKIDCVNAFASALRPNARKTRKPTKKVRRNRHANSRRN